MEPAEITIGAMVRYLGDEYEVVKSQGDAVRLRNNRVPPNHPNREIGVSAHQVTLLLHPGQQRTQVDRASLEAMARAEPSVPSDPSEPAGEETSEPSRSVDLTSQNSDATLSSLELASRAVDDPAKTESVSAEDPTNGPN